MITAAITVITLFIIASTSSCFVTSTTAYVLHTYALTVVGLTVSQITLFGTNRYRYCPDQAR